MVEGEGDRPRVVCICGSTRHRTAILDAVRAETLQGRVVLAPGVFSQADGELLADDVVDMLTGLHAAKIELADEVVVIDVDGVGEATGREVDLAQALGKPVRFWTPVAEQRSLPIDPDAALRESHRVQRLVANDVPTTDVPQDVKELRCALVEEEAAELREAIAGDDIVGIADAIADLLYVVHGAALTFGIPTNEVFAEVHRSNMTKLGADGAPILRADGMVMKGPNYSPPRLEPILRAHGYGAEGNAVSDERDASAPVRSQAAALADAASAVFEYEEAAARAKEHLPTLRAPLAVEVWVFDPEYHQVLLVEHRWRRWVPPGGKVEPGETPRTAAERELFEETGLLVELKNRPAAAAIRSYHPDWPATLGLSYAAIADPSSPLLPEEGQAVAWTSLAEPWASAFPDDIDRMRAYVEWLRDVDEASD
jgi:8-oxo-dGTP diphosphatase